ncbi:MAG: transcription antitermination factor NusB [Verrucomicrobiota bacterium]|nr:transcription antitermination factor NusB [Verrucomicrobiota bacterium]
MDKVRILLSMTLHAQKFREILFQLLFSVQFCDESEELVEMMMAQLAVTKRSVRDAVGKLRLLMEKVEEIDAKIASFSEGYSLDRISLAEKCALRLGVFELLYAPEEPAPVVLAEAVRIVRKFGSREGAQFVNALLDTVYRKKEASCDGKVDES